MSVSRQTTLLPGAGRVDHLPREDARVLDRLHERAVARPSRRARSPRAPSASFFDMIDEAISGIDVDGRRDVAQRVELLVGRDEVAGLADDRDADLAHLRDELVDRSRSTRKPGIDSSLSSVPPVWPRPRPDIIGNGTPHAATSGRERERHLVADAAGRVLVDDAPAERRREVDACRPSGSSRRSARASPP